MKNFISLDLELTQPSQKIIQIGAVVFQFEPFKIIEELSMIINPQEKLTDFIIKLTGISQEQVDNGVDLQIAYGKLCEMKIKHNCESYPVVWGGGDSECLKNQIKTVYNDIPFVFGRRFFDTKTLYQAYRLSNGLTTQSGLKKSMGRCGLVFEGPAHDALKDAKNTAIFFKWLCDTMKI